MATIQLRLTGLDKLARKMDAATRDTVIKTSITQGALNMQQWVQRKRLSGPRPSVLGVVTGRLRSSIAVRPTQKSGKRYIASIGTNVEYGPKHEFGIGVRPRPFLKPAVEDRDNQNMVLKILSRNIQNAIRGAR